MDYYGRLNLSEHVLLNGAFTEADAREITEQLLLAVYILHRNSIIHRDIKPEVSKSPLSGYLRNTPLTSIEYFNSLPLPNQYPACGLRTCENHRQGPTLRLLLRHA